MVWLGWFFFHQNPLLSPHHREKRQSLSCCVFVIHGQGTFFTLPELGFFVKQSQATSPWLININYFARELGQIIVIYNQLLSPPQNGKSFSGRWVAQKVHSWSWSLPSCGQECWRHPEPQLASVTSDRAARGSHCSPRLLWGRQPAPGGR